MPSRDAVTISSNLGEELAAVTLSSAQAKEKVVQIDKSDKKLGKFDQDKDGFINGEELQDMAKKEVVNEPVYEPKKATKEEKSLKDKILTGIKISTKNGSRTFLHKYDLNKDGYTDLQEGFTAVKKYVIKKGKNMKDGLMSMTHEGVSKIYVGPRMTHSKIFTICQILRVVKDFLPSSLIRFDYLRLASTFLAEIDHLSLEYMIKIIIRRL
uniref:EF-hand domain-containing protein n=1 Tax=Romanomermis culicivorax TaxID=13658 RepID=A0A915KGX1_ROMCU